MPETQEHTTMHMQACFHHFMQHCCVHCAVCILHDDRQGQAMQAVSPLPTRSPGLEPSRPLETEVHKHSSIG
eukprot:146478-Pelagomonas_calceolata.AAC.2